MHLLLALALLVSVLSMPATNGVYTMRLYTRLQTGEVVSLPSDDSEFTVYCDGYSDGLTSHPLETGYDPVTHGWYVDLLQGFDTALWCYSDGMTWLPAWVEDHDAPDGMIILDAASPQTVSINRDKRGLWVPLTVRALVPCSPDVGVWLDVILPIQSEHFASPGDGGPQTSYTVLLPDGGVIHNITYMLPYRHP